MLVYAKKILIYVKTHPLTTIIIFILASPVTALVYQVVGDVHDGRWSSGLAIYLHSEPLQSQNGIYVFYASPRVPSYSRLIIPVEVTAFNDSKKGVKKVALSLRYPLGSDRQKLPESWLTNSGTMSSNDTSHDLNASDKYVYSNYRVISMPPMDRINFSEGGFAVPTSRDVPAFHTQGLGFDIKVSISSEENAATEVDLRYRGVVAEDGKDVAEWLKKDYGVYIAQELRAREGFWGYLWGWMIFKKVTVFGMFPSFISLEDGKFFVPTKKPDDYKRYRFSPYFKEFIF